MIAATMNESAMVECSPDELAQVDGGIVPVLYVGAVLCLSVYAFAAGIVVGEAIHQLCYAD